MPAARGTGDDPGRRATIDHVAKHEPPAATRSWARLTALVLIAVGAVGFVGVGFLSSGDPRPGETTNAPDWARPVLGIMVGLVVIGAAVLAVCAWRARAEPTHRPPDDPMQGD